jgi:hypothetical protein
MGREVVVAITEGRLDFGPWEQIFSGQAFCLARRVRRAAAEAGAGQDHRGVVAKSLSRRFRADSTFITNKPIHTESLVLT